MGVRRSGGGGRARLGDPLGVEASARRYAQNLLLNMDPRGQGYDLAHAVVVSPMLQRLLGVEDVDALSPRQAEERVLAWQARHRRRTRPPPPTRRSGENLALLAALVDLSADERALLDFLFVARRERGIRRVLNIFHDLPVAEQADAISSATMLSSAVVRDALRPEATLRAAGVVNINPNSSALCFELSPVIDEVLDRGDLDPQRLRDALHPAAPRTALTGEDFAHLADAFATARGLLAAALARRQPGINLLLYGAPGTGKTCFAALLAQELGVDLRVAGASEADDGGQRPRERLASLQLGNRVLRDGASMLLFDELEDVELSTSWPSSADKPSKQWVNRLLESNPVPTIWVTNDVSRVDAAFLRRFAWSAAFPRLSIRQRARVLSRHLSVHDAVDDAAISGLASRFRVEAAVLASAVSHARLVAPDGVVRAESLERLLAPAQRLLLGDRVNGHPKAPVPWAPSGVRADVDLVDLAARLADWRPSDDAGLSMLFHGPPGTGKTEFAHHLAERMGRPLLRRRTSDLLGKFVGETEKSIARAFRDARADDAVLVLDEADSLLRSREQARYSWEVTQVNELLQQLEAFRGVVICTTNAKDALDAAALRRFVVKVGFDYLDTSGAAALFEHALRPLATDPHPPTLRGVGPLAAGDFAAVRRRVLAIGLALSTDALVAELRAEVRARVGERRRIGWG